ncbi:uncharacterized protein LOC110976199 [Acanthaster planci]|uniref:Uncharacterized protein LOC110976199 n=1 Tax=Acanthaster planci TaxID=133434 RepID=A0A8B7XY68_ACAPL|nr:uncharacterized protein LOC110976199 [Acanthaster planci]
MHAVFQAMAASVRQHLVTLCLTACVTLCCATNETSSSLQLQPSPSPPLSLSSIAPSDTLSFQLHASSSVISSHPPASVLPSGPPSFQTRGTRVPLLSSRLPTPTPVGYPTPTPSWPSLTPQSEVLRTPTPSASWSTGFESPVASAVTNLFTTQVINASQSDQWRSSSAPFPVPPVAPGPPPYFTSMTNMTETVTDILVTATSNLLTTAVPEPSQQMTMKMSPGGSLMVSETEMSVSRMTSSISGAMTMLTASPAVSYTPRSTPTESSVTYRPMPTQSFVMSTAEPTHSFAMSTTGGVSGPLPTPSLFPSSEPWDNDTLPTAATTQGTDLTTWTSTVEVHTSPPRFILVKCTVTLNGDCNEAKEQEQLFREAFAQFIAGTLEMDVGRLIVEEVRCGSVVVDFTIQDAKDGSLAQNLTIMVDEGDLGFTFQNQSFMATYAGIRPPKPTKKAPDDKGGLSFAEQERLIYIMIGSAVGAVVLISLILVVHHHVRRSCRTHTQSFDIQEEPHIKLSDFNMAHTYIPRPRSIYGSRPQTDSTYHANGDSGSLHRGVPHSPTPYVYADDQAIRRHYREVVDRDANIRMSQDFGRSGVPDLNLPKLEGVHVAGQEDDIDESLLRPLSVRRGSNGSTVSRLSATFHAPPEPPPESASNASSSEAASSLPGDTSLLLCKGCDYDPQPMGIDNPSYDRCTAGDHEGQRAPSFYNMIPSAPV